MSTGKADFATSQILAGPAILQWSTNNEFFYLPAISYIKDPFGKQVFALVSFYTNAYNKG